MQPYANFTAPILAKPIKKSKKVFDDTKITDHHAIIPTGVNPSGLILEEKRVYDSIARRFIAAFYPDCIVSNTTVIGEVAGFEFKATGKVIIEDGWRVLYPKKDADKDSEPENDEGQIMPDFVKGEMGEHIPDLLEKQTQPPKMLTEATLLRAMETAGKQVEDDELRELMKENGIGRPSTRANIIETLFKRKFVIREKKNLVPTQTGIQLINTIQNELLKSAELTGIWEKKIRQIEKGEYDAKLFLEEMKQMVSNLVMEVQRENQKSIDIEQDKIEEQKSTKSEIKKQKEPKQKNNEVNHVMCPKCKQGTLLKGNSAYGCSAYKQGCTFKVLFEQFGKKLNEKQIYSLVQKGTLAKLKGYRVESMEVDLSLSFDSNWNVVYVKA